MILALVGLALALNVRTGENMAAGVAWAFASALSMTVVYYLNANALRALDGRLRTFAMTAVTALLVIVLAGAAGAQALPRDDRVGRPCAARGVLLYRNDGALLCSAARARDEHRRAQLRADRAAVARWLFLGHTLSAQVVGAFVTVGAIAWLGGE